ncbi:MAG: hypothetical protein LBF24_00745 [Puniceicoccales bacterium]|nr:hypothetical protein [Puniceicoccales bacterium]
MGQPIFKGLAAANSGKKHAKKRPHGNQPIKAGVSRHLRHIKAKKDGIELYVALIYYVRKEFVI